MKNFPIKITEDIMVDGENMKGKTVWHSRSCAVAVFVFSNANNEWSVAAVKRGTGCPNNVGKWCCPCGYVDYDETVQGAAARELFEECGLKTGNTTYDFTCNESEIEEVVKYVSILNKLKPLKDHWGIFDNYKKEYPGEYIGLSEEEYNIFTELSCYDGNDAIKVEICDCLRSETEYSFLVFQGVEIYYYNKNNTKYKVEWN